MRKRIPTINRPDHSYAATLSPSDEARPTAPDTTKVAAGPPTPLTVHMPSSRPAQPPQHIVGAGGAQVRMAVRQAPEASRKVDIRVNALVRQETALVTCGVNPAHVVRAALRRAVKGWALAPVYYAASEEARSRMTDWQARTSLAVNAEALSALLRQHDPLEVLSKWTLVRGQLEDRVWSEIDTILAEIMTAETSSDSMADADSEQGVPNSVTETD